MMSGKINESLESPIIRLCVQRYAYKVVVSMIGVNHENRGRGLCRDTISYIEDYCRQTGDSLWIEDVLSENLKNMLKRRGYKKSGKDFYLSANKLTKSIKS